MNSLKLAEHGFQPMFYPIDKNDCTCTGKNCLAGMAGVWIQVEEVVEDGATDDDDNGDTETSTTVPNTYSNTTTKPQLECWSGGLPRLLLSSARAVSGSLPCLFLS